MMCSKKLSKIEYQVSGSWRPNVHVPADQTQVIVTTLDKPNPGYSDA